MKYTVELTATQLQAIFHACETCSDNPEYHTDTHIMYWTCPSACLDARKSAIGNCGNINER
jgi:hypothetical protein